MAEREQSAARDLRLSNKTDFIASPLHCVVRPWAPRHSLHGAAAIIRKTNVPASAGAPRLKKGLLGEVDVSETEEAPAMRAQQKLLALNEAEPLRLYPDELQFLFAVRADWPRISRGFHKIKFLRHKCFHRPNIRDQRLATERLSTPTDFIASPLHRFVRLFATDLQIPAPRARKWLGTQGELWMSRPATYCNLQRIASPTVYHRRN